MSSAAIRSLRRSISAFSRPITTGRSWSSRAEALPDSMAFSSASAPPFRRASAAAIVYWSRSGAVGRASSSAAWASGRSRFASVMAADSRTSTGVALAPSNSRSRASALRGIDRGDGLHGLRRAGRPMAPPVGDPPEIGNQLGELELAGRLDPRPDLVGTVDCASRRPAERGRPPSAPRRPAAAPRSWLPCWIAWKSASRSAGPR